MSDFNPTAGTIFLISRRNSVQFAEPFAFRLIRVLHKSTYHGWVWLDGYQLDARRQAVVRRELFVKRDGLKVLRPR